MSKENTLYHDLDSSSKEKLSNTHLSKPITSYTGNSKHAYTPHMRTNYHPSDDSVESATGVDFPINMPNPVEDPIVANNISNAEFDYTEDLTSSEDEPSD